MDLVHTCSLDVGFVEFDQVEAMAHDLWKRVSHYGKAPKRGGEVAPRLTKFWHDGSTHFVPGLSS